MNHIDNQYLWEILRLALFNGREKEAQLLANACYDTPRNLTPLIEGEVVDYGIRGEKNLLTTLAWTLIEEPEFDGVEKFNLITYMVVNDNIDPVEALKYISDASTNKLQNIYRQQLSSLVDFAWHYRQDKEQGFMATVDLDRLRAEWTRAFDGLMPAAS